MKKMVFAALAAMAMGANAAPTWTVTGLEGYNGYTIVYVAGQWSDTLEDLNKSGADNFASLYFLGKSELSKAGMSSYADFYQFLNVYVSSATIANGTATGALGTGGIPTMAMFALFEDGIVPGGAYKLMKSVEYTSATVDTYDTINVVFDMSNASVLSSGNLYSDGVPEPTSGLLLLVGMGLLGLKRKRV